MSSSSERELCRYFQTSRGCKFTSEQCRFAHVRIESSNFRNFTSNSNFQDKSQFKKIKNENSWNNLHIDDSFTPKSSDAAPVMKHRYTPPTGDSERESKYRSKQKNKLITNKTVESKEDKSDNNEVGSAKVKYSLSKNINFHNWKLHRENEIQALGVLYPSFKETMYRSVVSIIFDFQFSNAEGIDINSFPIKLIFPNEYPLREMIKIDLMLKPDSDSTLQIIERSIKFWLTQKSLKLKKLKRSELVVEPLLKWMDSSLPHLIRDNLHDGNLYTDTSSRVSQLYKTQVKQVLSNDFPMFRKGDLDVLLAKHNHHYAPSHKAVMEGFEASGLRITDDKKLVGKNNNRQGRINFIPVLVPNEGNISLFIGNVPENVNLGELKLHFLNAGIKVKKIIKPGEKPFVFINLKNREDFDAAMKLNGSYFKGSRLSVNIAKYSETSSTKKETPSVSFTVSPDCISVETIKGRISAFGITIKDLVKSRDNIVYSVYLTSNDDIERMKLCLQRIFTEIDTRINFVRINMNDDDDESDDENDEDEVSHVLMRIHILRKPSKIDDIEGEIDSKLKKEIDFVSKILNEFKKQNIIECDCCFEEFFIPEMISCTNGHLFCTTCLQSYTKESIFGQGRTELLCMTTCDGYFLKNQLEKGLPADLLEKYEVRARDESINMANLDNLFKCPDCDYAVLLEGDYPFFLCQNCEKVLCKNCLSEWDNKKANTHFLGLCVKKEDSSDVLFRKSYEEKMTEVCIRTCPRCKTQFMKEDGCNKIVCKCGLKTCYVCRAVITDYTHFCQHLRDQGKNCKQCNRCFLFEDMEKNDEKKIIELKKEATENRRVKGQDDFKPIGVLTANEEKIKKEEARAFETRFEERPNVRSYDRPNDRPNDRPIQIQRPIQRAIQRPIQRPNETNYESPNKSDYLIAGLGVLGVAAAVGFGVAAVCGATSSKEKKKKKEDECVIC